MTTVEIQIIVYGSCSRDPENDDRYGADQRRVEILLNPILPADATTMPKKHKWLQEYLRNLPPDMKHNRNWRCEFCKVHARETVWMNSSWMHLTPPRALSYVHHVCNAAVGPCAENVRAIDAEMARMNNLPPTFSIPARDLDITFPMSASCAVCHDESEKSRKHLKQCAKCELTRYCSVDCQREDWSRHKICCKSLKEVKWHWT
ncbi:MYND-type domain-containing protein [Favolaschia claudopus]|uniref:MYND-type domain-containing protein n=1 Tax=Favolaschia claudopus TaxID=2862362 RepID=A0AAW0DMF6_9AGAR